MKRYFKLALIILGLLSSIYLSLLLYVGAKAESWALKKADAILVLGARSYINGSYNPCLVARVGHAVNLYKSHVAPKLIFSGGTDREDNANEAETMKKMAMEKGIPEEDILLENEATSTYENFKLSKSLIDEAGFKSVLVVTEPFHVARSELVGKKLGYNQSFSPAGESPCWKPNKYLTKYFLKEPFAIIVYKLKNQI